MAATDIMRVYIDISNPTLYSLLKEYNEIVSTQRTLDDYESLPSCTLYVTDKELNHRTDKDSISLKYDIYNRHDSRWLELFPSSFQSIITYLRFALLPKDKTDISPDWFHQLEDSLINSQESIVKDFQAFYISLAEFRATPNENLYEYRVIYSLHNKIVNYNTRKFNQLEHEINDQDSIIDNSVRLSFTAFTNSINR